MGIWGPIIGGIVRWALMLLLAPLVARGIIDQETLDNFVGPATVQIGAAVLLGLTLLWSLFQKMIANLRQKTALAAPPGTTAAEVKADVAAMPLPEKLAEAIKSDPRGR